MDRTGYRIILNSFQLQIGIVTRSIKSAICLIIKYTRDIQLSGLIMNTARTVIHQALYIVRSSDKEHIFVILENNRIGVLALLTTVTIPFLRTRMYRIFIRTRNQITGLITCQITIPFCILHKACPRIRVFRSLGHKGLLLIVRQHIAAVNKLTGIGIEIDIGPIAPLRIFTLFSKNSASVLRGCDGTGTHIIIECRINDCPKHIPLIVQFGKERVAVVL